ncbi:MAG: SapC family protein [Pseudomonadota bacterium]
MTKQLMIYERAVPVQAEAHRDWSVKTGTSYAFAASINSAPLLAPEFASTAQDYAIVFAGEGDTVFPAVILGLRDDQNAFVAPDGSWTGRYIPAFLRRYPFVFAASGDAARLTLCIDAEFEGVNTEGRGERLFDSEGNRTRYLDEMLAFTTEYQQHFARTEAFCKRLVEHDLLDKAQVRFEVPGGGRSELRGFRTVSREKLRALPDEAVLAMARSDDLELCYLHMNSLGNLGRMAERIADAEAAPRYDA